MCCCMPVLLTRKPPWHQLILHGKAARRSIGDVLLRANDASQEVFEHLKLTKEQRFSLEHAEELLEGCSEADVQEMTRVVLGELGRISGAALHLQLLSWLPESALACEHTLCCCKQARLLTAAHHSLVCICQHSQFLTLLLAVAGASAHWHMERAGGARRSSASHDADFVLWRDGG